MFKKIGLSLLLFISISCSANSIDVFTEFEWGQAPLTDVVSVNGYLFGYSSNLRGFYLFEQTNNNWSLKSTLKLNLRYARNSAMVKRADDTVALVSSVGELHLFNITTDGQITQTKHDLSQIDVTDRINMDKGGPFKFYNDKLAVVGGYPEMVHVFNIQDPAQPQLVSTWPIPSQWGISNAVALGPNSLWLTQDSALTQLTSDDDFATLTPGLQFEAESGVKMNNIGLSQNLIMTSRSKGITHSGYYAVDLTQATPTLIVQTEPVFEAADSEENIAHFKWLENNTFLLTYPTKLVIADFANPQAPTQLDAFEQLEFLFGKSSLLDGTLNMPTGIKGFATIGLLNNQFGAVNAFESIPASFGGIHMTQDHVFLSRSGNVGALGLSKNSFRQLISGEAPSLLDRVEFNGFNPSCMVESEQWIYGYSNRQVVKIDKITGAPVSNIAITVTDESITGWACTIVNDTVFVTGGNARIWSAPLADIKDPAKYSAIDLTGDISPTGSTRVLHMVNDGTRLFVASWDGLVIMTQNDSGQWAVSQTVDITALVVANTNHFNSNIIGLDIFGNNLLLSDNNSGHIFRFDLNDGGFEFADVTPAVPASYSDNAYGLVDLAQWNDFIIASAGDTPISIFKQKADGSLERISDIVLQDEALGDIVVFDDYLMGLNFAASLVVYSIKEIVTEQTFELDEDAVIFAKLDIDDRYTNLVLQPGEFNGQIELTGNALVYQPQPNFNGQTIVMVTADNQASTQNFTVTFNVAAVNDAPVAEPGSASGQSATNITGTVSASDADNDVLSYSVTTDVTNGTLTLGDNGQFDYVSNVGFTGTDSFVFSVSDSSGASSQAEVTLNVTAPDPQPDPQQPDPEPEPEPKKDLSGLFGGSFGGLFGCLMICLCFRRRRMA
ncbi:MAG: cadherin-like domain-containing protein [Algicola sp.]|nr:cadherin-like domain-containing protein [Algicola sp.]